MKLRDVTASRGLIRLTCALAAIWLTSACAELGFTNRVLWRVPSPAGRYVAVCQEVPAFDGPGFTVRLEQPNGTLVRRLYEIGDADGCSEMAWSPDGRLLAMLTAHVARLRFVDVEWALAHGATQTAWSWRQMDMGPENQLLLGRNLRFVAPAEFELETCPYRLAARRESGTWTCLDPPVTRRMTVPEPVATRHSSSTE